MKYKSKVVKAFFSKNYQVEFSIDHQTFRLEQVEPDFKISSKDKAEWYKKQLDAAFERVGKCNTSCKAKIIECSNISIKYDNEAIPKESWNEIMEVRNKKVHHEEDMGK